MDTTQPTPLLGGLSPQQFMQRHWQKRPLLVRQAIADFTPLLDRAALFALAEREEVESRLLQCGDAGWKLRHGPLPRRALPPIKKPNWTVLVQGVDLHVEAVHRLMQRFRFVPDARLDDVMISWASDGGGVGPHVDAYDVFLIQLQGRRRWRVAPPGDSRFVDGLPLRILQRFEPTQEWVLEPGDMLYLPPRFAHNGVALGDCMTWSVGFRAPKAQEIVGRFLDYLQDHLQLEGIYADPELKRPRHPGEIPSRLLDWTEETIRKTRWNKSSITEFLGLYLSEPKAHVFFDPPARPYPPARFSQVVAKSGVRLDPRSQLLFRGRQFFMNGEKLEAPPGLSPMLRKLADRRQLPPGPLRADLLEILYDWYRAGFLAI